MKLRNKVAAFLMLLLAGSLSACGILAPRPNGNTSESSSSESSTSSSSSSSDSGGTTTKPSRGIYLYANDEMIDPYLGEKNWVYGTESASSFDINDVPRFYFMVKPNNYNYYTPYDGQFDSYYERLDGSKFYSLPREVGIYHYAVDIPEDYEYAATSTYTKFRVISVNETPETEQDCTGFNGENPLNIISSWRINNKGDFFVNNNSYGIFSINLQRGNKAGDSCAYARVADGTKRLYGSGITTLTFKFTDMVSSYSCKLCFENIVNGRKATTTTGNDKSGKSFDIDISSVLSEDCSEYKVSLIPLPDETYIKYGGYCAIERVYLSGNIVDPITNELSYPEVYLENPSYCSSNIQYGVNTNGAHSGVIHYSSGTQGQVDYRVSIPDDLSWVVPSEYNKLIVEINTNANVTIIIRPFDNERYSQVCEVVGYTTRRCYLDIPSNIVDFSKPISLLITTTGYDVSINLFGFRLCRNSANISIGNTARLTETNTLSSGLSARYTQQHDLTISYNVNEAGYGNIVEMIVSSPYLDQSRFISGTLIADSDVRVIIKPGDDSANEVMLELHDGDPLNVNSLFNNPINPMWGKLIIMIATPGTTDLRGTITFKNFFISPFFNENIKAMPSGYYTGFAYVNGAKTHVAIEFTDESITASIGDEIMLVPSTAIDYLTHSFTLMTNTAKYGMIQCNYYVIGDYISDITVSGSEASVFNTSTVTIQKVRVLFDCNESTNVLQQIFKRRYMSGSWQVDTTNSDRFVQDSDHSFSGSSMKRRGWTGGAVSINLNQDLDGIENLTRFGFWVYNPSDRDIGLRIWIYRSTGLTNHAELTNGTNSDSRTTAKAGQWTHISIDLFDNLFPAGTKVYNFQIADFGNTGVALSFDNIYFI